MKKKHTLILVWFSSIIMYVMVIAEGNFATNIHQHCWGHYRLYQGDKPLAWRLLNKVGKNQAEYEKFTFAGKVELLFENKQYNEIITLYNANQTYFDSKIYLKKMYALSLAKTGKFQQSDHIFMQLNKQHPTDSEIGFYAVNAYITQKDLHNALQIINQLLTNNNSNNNFIFYFLQSQIYLELNNLTQAKISAEKALQLNPDFDKAWLLFSIVAEKEESWEKAIEGYNAFLSLQKNSTTDQQIKRHILELMLLQEKSIKNNKTTNHLLDRFNEALVYTKHKNYKQALTCINVCTKQEAENKTYALLKIEILLHLKEYKQLADYCSFLINQNTADNYWHTAIHYIARKEKAFLPHAISLLEHYAAHNNTTALLYLAHIYIVTKQWNKAESILKTLSFSLQDKPLACAVNHQLALIYFLQEQYHLVIETLKNNLTHFPNHVPSLNLLANAYIETKNIEKAEKIIAKARVIDTKNPHLMDTQAVVLLEQGQLTQAKDLLSKALAIAPSDATIILHLAQIEYQEGDLVHAQELLDQAKKEAFYDHEHRMAKKLYNTWFPRQ